MRAFRNYWTLMGSLAILTTGAGVYFASNMLNIDWGDDLVDPHGTEPADSDKSPDSTEI